MKHTKFTMYALILPFMAVFASCLPEGSQTFSYSGAWGTVEYDSGSGLNFVRADNGILMSNNVFLDMKLTNRVVMDYSLDAAKFTVLSTGEACYTASVSNCEEIPLESTFASLADTANADKYGTHAFDNVALYKFIATTNVSKRNILSLSTSYTGADDTYPLTIIRRTPVIAEGQSSASVPDTIKFEVRCDNGGKTGTRPYLRSRAYDITQFIAGFEKAVVQLTFTAKTSAGTQQFKDFVAWTKPKEEEKDK